MNKELPSALKLNNTAPAYSKMRVETSIIEPIINTTAEGSTVRFVLEKKAMLDTNSIVTLGIKSASGVSSLFLPIGAGITSAIQRCRCKIGNYVLQDVDDFAYLFTYMSKFKAQEEREKVDSIRLGTADSVCPSTQSGKVGRMSLKNLTYTSPSTAVVNSINAITDNDATTFVGSIKLHELFSIFKSFSLPLYLLNDPLVIEFDLRQQANAIGTLGQVACRTLGSGDAVNIEYSKPNIMMLVDYLSYESELQDEVARQVMSEEGLNIAYEDILLYNATLPAVANPGGTATRVQNETVQLGLGNRLVNWICLQEKEAGTSNGLMGDYFSQAHPIPDEVNMRVNDLQYLNRPVSRESEKFNYVEQVHDVPLQIHNAEYSWDTMVNKLAASNELGSSANNPKNQDLFDDLTLQGHQANLVQANSHYTAFSLATDRFSKRPTRVGVKPILLERTLKRTAQDYQAYDQRIYASVTRSVQLRNGEVSVSA